MWSYTNWSVNQPDDAYSGEDYLYFYRRDSNAWNDAGLPTGDLKRSFICEWDNMGDLVDILKKTDIDGDNDVDGFDLLLFSNAFGTNLSSLNYDPLLDFEEDGDVDQFDLAVITYMFGQTEVPLIIANVPALDQSDYTDADQNTYLESVSSIAAGGCVSASFTSMFLGHFNEFGLQNYIDTSTDTSDTLSLMDDITLTLMEEIPENEWWDFLDWTEPKMRITEQLILNRMNQYEFTFDRPNETLNVQWGINYFTPIATTNTEFIQYIKNKLDAGESVFFAAHLTNMGSHASVITGYTELEGKEYFRVNDTWDISAKWYEIERDDAMYVDIDTGVVTYAPLKLHGNGKEWVLKYSVANPTTLNFNIIPKY